MSKNIIFNFDGTGNNTERVNNYKQDSSISNILKLHTYLGGTTDTKSYNKDQHSFYYKGVGTRGNRFQRIINALVAPKNGDMEDILKEANKDLEENYVDGDTIFITGFSRGAAIARMFASRCPHDIEFLGVFDTVAATLGSMDLDTDTYPDDIILFENNMVGNHVKQIVHLVSLDENRILFQPTLVTKDERVTEIWMPGVHSDVGGGYWFDGLSDVALQYMINRLRSKEAKIFKLNNIDLTNSDMCFDDIHIKPLIGGTIHTKHRSIRMSKLTLSPRKLRVDSNTDDSPIIHYSVVERFNKVMSYRPVSLRNAKFRVMGKDGKIVNKLYTGIKGLSEYGSK